MSQFTIEPDDKQEPKVTTDTDNDELHERVKLLVRNENNIKRALDEIREIHDFVYHVKNKESEFFKYTGDKEYVIVGTVAIAIMAIFWIPDPGNVVMAIVTGLFGLATGRYMGKGDK